MFDLKGKTALVTGAATGLGAAIAAALAWSGADLVVTDRPGEDLEPTANAVVRAGRHVERVPLDVRDLKQIQSGVAAARRVLGRIDVLVNNAGINRPAPA